MEINQDAQQRAARAMAHALSTVPEATSATLTCRFTEFSSTRQAVAYTADGTAVHPSFENVTFRLLVEEAMEALQPAVDAATTEAGWTIEMTVRDDHTWESIATVGDGTQSHTTSGSVAF